jgi:hypothetical protein
MKGRSSHEKLQKARPLFPARLCHSPPGCVIPRPAVHSPPSCVIPRPAVSFPARLCIPRPAVSFPARLCHSPPGCVHSPPGCVRVRISSAGPEIKLSTSSRYTLYSPPPPQQGGARVQLSPVLSCTSSTTTLPCVVGPPYIQGKK